MKPIPLIKPYITRDIKDKVCEVLDSGYLTEGPVTSELETLFKDYIGCKHALALTSCTTGLETALRAFNIGPGDEVIVPDYTYPATADVVNIVGATCVIVDINPDTMLIDYDAIESSITNKTKAIIPVSLFGNPLDYTRLNKIKAKYNLIIIEDAACAIGTEYNNIKAGNFADISVFSLHPRKFIATGEGGIITTNNTERFNWMGAYKHFGMNSAKERIAIQFEMIGTNYKLSNVLSAIGVVQMKNIRMLLEKRIELSNNYITLLKNNPKVKIPQISPLGKHSYQSFCVFVDNRDLIIQNMKHNSIETQIGTYSLHIHNAFVNNQLCRIAGTMENSNYCFDHCLTLPLYHDLSFDDQEYIIEQLNRYL